MRRTLGLRGMALVAALVGGGLGLGQARPAAAKGTGEGPGAGTIAPGSSRSEVKSGNEIRDRIAPDGRPGSTIGSPEESTGSLNNLGTVTGTMDNPGTEPTLAPRHRTDVRRPTQTLDRSTPQRQPTETVSP